jgi:hypothetical protein
MPGILRQGQPAFDHLHGWDEEEQFLRLWLGADCSRPQKRLFYCLLDGGFFRGRLAGTVERRIPIRSGNLVGWVEGAFFTEMEEDDVIEVVYQLSRQDGKRRRDSCRSSLRQLQASLNNRFLKRRLPFTIWRPRNRFVQLVALSALMQERDRLPPDAPKGKERAHNRVTFEACKSFLRRALFGGREPKAEEIKAKWRARGGSLSVLRRAFRDMNVQSFHDGYGPGSAWRLRLSADPRRSR